MACLIDDIAPILHKDAGKTRRQLSNSRYTIPGFYVNCNFHAVYIESISMACSKQLALQFEYIIAKTFHLLHVLQGANFVGQLCRCSRFEAHIPSLSWGLVISGS